MPIGGASDPVVRLAIFDRQQPHDHVRPSGIPHLWPTPRHHDRLTNPEAMSRHGGHLGWHRTENNGAAGYMPPSAERPLVWSDKQGTWRRALQPFGNRRPVRTTYRLFIRSALCRFGQLGFCEKTIIGR